MTWKRAAPAGGVVGEMGRVGGESRGALAGPLPENRRREGGSDGRREVSDLEEEHVLRRNKDVSFGHTNLEMPLIHWFGPPTFQ